LRPAFDESSSSLREFETADCFTERERAVIPYAKEATRHGRVPDAIREKLGFLGDRQRLELLLPVAWYICVVRIVLPLHIVLEPWLVRQ
jgi:alkylhydroperoxidase family enzyme